MRTIAVINQKGGVGKTTTTVNLGAALAAAGQRVCLIDLDPQAHATLHLGVTPQADYVSIYSVLLDDRSLEDALLRVDDKLWLVGSHIDLAAADVELAGVPGRELLVREKISAWGGQFDYLLIDCPPSLGLLTLNALAAVDEVFIPLQPHFLALHGLSKLLETIDLVGRRLNPPLRLSGIVRCVYDTGTRLATEVDRDVAEFLAQARQEQRRWSRARLCETRIRRNIRLAEAPGFGQSIFAYAPQSHGAEDYRQLAEEILRDAPLVPIAPPPLEADSGSLIPD